MTYFFQHSVHMGPYLDGGLHENCGGIIYALGTEMQHRCVTLLGYTCQGFVNVGFAADQCGMHEAPIKNTGALSSRAQQP